MKLTLEDMGFDGFFCAQLSDRGGAGADVQPYRISEVHRDRLSGLAPTGPQILRPADGQQTGAFAVGDWVLANASGGITRLLERKSLLHRRAAGSDARRQLIAANCDTLFITSSCNADFNPARLERFLVLAYEGGCAPVIVLTKADQANNLQEWHARAQALDPRVPVLVINAQKPDDLRRLGELCPKGHTGALVGSSGVGKTTITNGLCARNDATGAIREDDARGRHITTSRTLRAMTNGGWIIDTPGMRALRLEDAGEGIGAMFADITELAEQCRFADCTHGKEPGCAVRAAVTTGRLDGERLARWKKLLEENARNSESLATSRKRRRPSEKEARSTTRAKKAHKGF